MQGLTLALPLAVAFGTALALTPLVARLARRMRVIDRPTVRGVNQRADMPLLGGIAVAAGFFAGIPAVAPFSADTIDAERWPGALAGGLLLAATGIWDDRFGMRALPKLTFPILPA